MKLRTPALVLILAAVGAAGYGGWTLYGEMQLRNTKLDPVAPGKRKVQLRYETAKGKFRPETLEIEMDLKPCTRYEITAQYDNPLGPNWKPKIKEEPIGECRTKFAAKK